MRAPSRGLGAAALSAFVILGTARAPGAESYSQESAEAAVAALGAQIEVEREIVKTQQEQYRRSAADRDAATRRLAQLLSEFDAMVQSPDPAPSDVLAAKEREIAEAERQRAAALERGRAIFGRIQEMQDRISGLERKVASLRESLPKAKETLTGGWQVTYLPGTNKGIFNLRQTGTIVQGQYQLDGGWRGSLQGTFIDGKLFLERIDSKLGRSSQLQGYLSTDGKAIRGTWQSYNLTDGAASSGSWTASRQED